MAKTLKKQEPAPIPSLHPRSHEAISEMLRSISVEEGIEIAKEAGILTTDGKLSPKYKNWGKGPTMTPTYEQLAGEK